MTVRGTEDIDAGILVVGGGIAGHAVCERVRERDPHVRLTLVCAEEHLPYDRVRLSELLVGDDGLDGLLLRPAEWFEDHDIRVLLGCRVSAADPVAGLAIVDESVRVRFDQLVLATGSQPLLPPLEGLDLANVFAYRTPADCAAIKAAARGASQAVVVGGGLLGLEAARGIAAQGAPTTVVHLMDRLMERQLDAGAAALLEPAFAADGISVLLEKRTARLLGDGSVRGLEFADGTTQDADLVVFSIGIRPETGLARAMGLAVERGIVVDDELRTSAPNVFAVGECAEHDGVLHGLVAPLLEQARACAAALCSSEARYEGSVPSAKLKVAGIDLVSIGAATGPAEAVVQDTDAGIYRKLVVRDGIAVGAILLGDVRGAEALLSDVMRRAAVEDPLERLAEAAAAGPEDLPDDAQVCNCNGVCKGDLVSAVLDGGAGTPREVMNMTRAGTGCGSCKTLVVDIVALATGGAVDEPAYLCPCRRQTREEVAGVIRAEGLQSVSEVAGACGTGRECGACKPAVAYLVSEINANRHREERDARFINDRVHANIQNDGTFSVVPRMRGGITTPDELRAIADAADKYDVPLVKVTGGQRIDLLGVRKEDLPGIWKDLGMPSGHAYGKYVRTVKTCVGTDFCRFGLGDAIGLGVEMEKAWEGLSTPHKVKSGVSGCARNCAEATVKDIGIVAIGEDRWSVRIGGAAGGNVRETDTLCDVGSRAEALRVATTFLQYYRENAEFKERTYDFVPRVGLEQIKAVVLDEALGAALRERFRIAKAAVVIDPWVEGAEPATANQFTELDALALAGPPSDGARS